MQMAPAAAANESDRRVHGSGTHRRSARTFADFSRSSVSYRPATATTTFALRTFSFTARQRESGSLKNGGNGTCAEKKWRERVGAIDEERKMALTNGGRKRARGRGKGAQAERKKRKREQAGRRGRETKRQTEGRK